MIMPPETIMPEPVHQSAPPSEETIRGLERQARQQMHEIQRLLVPNLRDLARAHLQPAEITGRLRDLAPAERDQLQFRLALALADLTSTRDAMEQYRNLIAAEIRRHHALRQAQARYEQARYGQAGYARASRPQHSH